MVLDRKRLILASASAARQSMLEASGLVFDVIPAHIDEGALRFAMGGLETVSASDVAVHLASEKALNISRQYPAAYVIGSDQVLALGPDLMSKASTLEEAREKLQRLNGQMHELVSAVTLARDGIVLWSDVDIARMAMRQFSDSFLDGYLAQCGDSLLRTVGCYEFEGLGVQLFDRIDGDYFTILGMPLLSLLKELRQRGVAAE